MIVLGCDPGATTGYCLLRNGKLQEAGVIEGNGALSQRLVTIYDAMRDIIHTFRPDLMVIEAVQFHPKRPGAVVPLAEVRGVIVLAAAQDGVEVMELTATAVKLAATGDGHASKTKVRQFVALQLDIPMGDMAFDVSDSCALALIGHRRQGRRAA